MRVDFYYWDFLCPLNADMLSLLNEYNDRLDIHTYNMADRPDLCEKLHIFYPTLTVVDSCHRYFAPVRRSFLESLVNGIMPKETPYRPSLGRTLYSGEILPIREENYKIAGNCVGIAECKGCIRKSNFLKQIGLSVFGFMNVQGEQLLGGAEYVPAEFVPYPIPHNKGTAFLTCVYLSDNDYDYKSAPLKELEKYLTESYDRVLVISDELGVFPNGDLAFFQKQGYHDMGVVAREDYCTLHLLEKYLKQDATQA